MLQLKDGLMQFHRKYIQLFNVIKAYLWFVHALSANFGAKHHRKGRLRLQ